MSIITDTKYLSLLSPRLDRFKKVRDYLWNFRCPQCGDSQKSKSKAKIIVSGDNISSEISLNDLLKEQEIIEVANTRLDDICLWLYSSGSTGRPKGTLHTHQNIMATANCYAKHVLKERSDDIFFSAPKLYFAYGLGNALTFPLSVGATSILMAGRPTVNSVMKIIREKKARKY